VHISCMKKFGLWEGLAAQHASWAPLCSYCMLPQTRTSRRLMRSSTWLSSHVCITSAILSDSSQTSVRSVPTLLLSRHWLFHVHDLCGCSKVGQDEPTCLYLDLFLSWVYISHGGKSLFDCCQAHSWRRESILASFHLRLPDHSCCVYLDANELSQ
jgi:hypothetical protein